ncbi:MAG: class III signal peptide-containing protein [Candidatus Omnitrophica bacterium]|nr:class III signal peptide-containing protein [Candidatus Omnitrophota bacterium]MDE2009518.1 class III signal peptide-containing protein [Candidatus Omnitrophota bacterium]MDE2214562.1 class III signal peptide-containing protein [Candidatus Omnitrophota bacterium]MDE2231639.1 class III signal peptide-containing protein [Candidatus Omnitrophota bacterium]
MHIKNKRGQITVEYILVVTAVLIVIVAFVTSKNGPFQNTLNSTYNAAVTEMNSETSQYAGSHGAYTSTDSGAPSGYSVNPTQ